MDASTVIPYQKQSDAQSSRTCGAACLSMVYGSFGKEIPQDEIWPDIAKINRFGSLASTTHLMARDALNRGFNAVAVQARHPLQALRLCLKSGVRAILNHRMRREAPAGHYSVLVHIDDGNVVLHDPLLGPSRSLTHSDLLELWLPQLAPSEIVGNLLIAIASPGASPAAACEFCHTQIPPYVTCPRCNKPISLQPSEVLGCINDACIARMWNYVCCPSCDYVWTFSSSPAHAAGSAGSGDDASASAPGPDAASSPATDLDVDKLFGAIDKFCNFVLTLPAAAHQPELMKQLDHIAGSKERFKLAYAEQLARRAAAQGQFATLIRALKEKEARQRRKMERRDTPSPPLDGDALGHALLKNVGLAD